MKTGDNIHVQQDHSTQHTQPVRDTLLIKIKKQAREYFNKEYQEMWHVAKQLLEKYKVFLRAIQILIEKVSSLQSMSFNDLQNIQIFTFGPIT